MFLKTNLGYLSQIVLKKHAITNSNERVIALFHHLFLQFRHIVEIDQKAHNTTTSRPPVPSILQILTTFNLYSGRPTVGLSVNNKQKVRQAMVKISRQGGDNHPPPLARYVSRNGLSKFRQLNWPQLMLPIKFFQFKMCQLAITDNK